MLNQHGDITEQEKKAELETEGKYWEAIFLIGVVILTLQHWVWIRSWFDFDDSTGSMIGILVIPLIAFIYKSFRNKLLTHHYIFKWISGGMYVVIVAPLLYDFIVSIWGYFFYRYSFYRWLSPVALVLLARLFVSILAELVRLVKSLIDSLDLT